MREEMDLCSAGRLSEGRDYVGERAFARSEQSLDDLGLEPDAAPSRGNYEDARELAELRCLKID
jgi:hypothetical protein